jgi:hypothetical protein
VHFRKFRHTQVFIVALAQAGFAIDFPNRFADPALAVKLGELHIDLKIALHVVEAIFESFLSYRPIESVEVVFLRPDLVSELNMRQMPQACRRARA